MTMTIGQLQDTLETLIDSNTLHDVIEALESVCYAKAGHIEENWQDATTAQPWVMAAQRLGEVNIHTNI